jgi:DNA modification methylase
MGLLARKRVPFKSASPAMKNKILQGDCLEVLKTLDDNSVDSIVTDPPAGISFMGKSWDTDKGGRDNWIKWMQEVATECKRVLKPGGHAFVWAIPRTSHWTATAWENAGFEIRDIVAHVFGSGFPKSHNIGKSVDKLQGNKRESEIVKGKIFTGSNNNINGEAGEYEVTKGTSQFEGWGSALKPAREDWLLMRKPLDKGLSIAENCLKWGTGGINIEQSRVPTPDDEARKQKILAGEVVCNAFCDKHGLYPSSLDDMLSFSQQQLLDFYQHIFSELGSYSISYTNLLHNLNGLDYKSCKQLLGVPYDCGRLSERVDEYVRGRQQAGGFQSDYPTLSRLYGECVRWNLDVAPDVFPLNNDVQSDILHYLSSKENNLLDNNPHLVFVLVLIAYSLLVNNNLHNHYTTCKNKKQAGRFPSNLLHDNSEEVRECFPESTSGARKAGFTNKETGYEASSYEMRVLWDKDVPAEKGNASRFFKSIIYQAKASKSERNKGCEEIELKGIGVKGNGLGRVCEFCGVSQLKPEECLCEVKSWINPAKNGNNHPTVKPIALMEYLIKMVTPKGGIVLDPFAGSGSTLIAAQQNGFHYIGIEMEADYIKIAEARLQAVPNKLF